MSSYGAYNVCVFSTTENIVNTLLTYSANVKTIFGWFNIRTQLLIFMTHVDPLVSHDSLYHTHTPAYYSITYELVNVSKV